MTRARPPRYALLIAALVLGVAAGPTESQTAAPESPQAPMPSPDESLDGAVPAGDDAGSDSESDSDSDSDSDRPVQLRLVTDAPCHIYVDQKLVGRSRPDEPLEVGVDLGAVDLRATSVEVPQAAWEKTLELTEPGEQTVRIKMNRTIRRHRGDERRSGVYRDPRTSLMWPKRDNGRDVDMRAAYAYCRDLRTGGFDDWRLPTLEQLASLEAIWTRATYKIQGDIALTECCMWSSEYDGSSRARTFNYRFRKPFDTNAGYQIGLRALCVRDWDPDAEPAADEAEDDAEDQPDKGERKARREARKESRDGGAEP